MPEFFKAAISRTVGGQALAIPPGFGHTKELAAILRPLADATILALRQLAQGLPVDKALVRERLGRYADAFLVAFDEVVRPPWDYSAGELQKSAGDILARLDALPKDRVERAERHQAIVDAVMEERRIQDEMRYVRDPQEWSRVLRWAESWLRELEKEAPFSPRERAFAAYIEEAISSDLGSAGEVLPRWGDFEPWGVLGRKLRPVPLEVYWDLLSAYPWGDYDHNKMEILEGIATISPEHADLFRKWRDYGERYDPKLVDALRETSPYSVPQQPPRPRRWSTSP